MDDLYYADTDPDAPQDPRRIAKREPKTGKKIDGKYDAKYFKNKHFFIDPFALTIAQWCYVKLNSQGTRLATPSSARDLLDREGHLSEI